MNYEILRTGLVALAVAMTAGACGDDSGGDDTTFGNTTNPTGATMTGGATMDDSGGDTASADSGDSGGAAVCNDTPTTSFETDIYPIIMATCVDDCHAAGGYWSSWLLEGDAATVYGIIVDGDGTGATQLLSDPDAELIVPCDPQNSYLYRKLLGEGAELIPLTAGLLAMPVECTTPSMDMPSACDEYTETPLPQADLDLIETWILDGAPE